MITLAMAESKVTGSCLCGTTTYTIEGKPQLMSVAGVLTDQIMSGFCHCRMCQRASSSSHMNMVGFKKTDVTWTSSPSEYQSSPKAKRLFCR